MNPNDIEIRLLELAESDRARNAPPCVEAALLREFAKQAAPHRAGHWRWWLAAAAAICAVVFATLPRPEVSLEISAVYPSASAPKAAVAARPIARRAVRPTRPQPAATPLESVTAFIPVVPGAVLEPGESGRVVRVQMPRTALGAFGFPVNEERIAERIPAEVLLGDDGSARAFRFVRVSRLR